MVLLKQKTMNKVESRLSELEDKVDNLVHLDNNKNKMRKYNIKRHKF
jgi:tetrahydromethanopterin S-methyltransferase subunit G